MLLRQGIPDIERWRISILATDINKYALEKAQRGIYGEWSFRQQTVDDPQVHPYFSKDSAGYQIHSSVKEMVRFAYLNLADESFPSSANQTDLLDLILCRNVTMYLSETVIQQLSRRFYASLQPGGWLMVGASENKDAFYSQFKTLMYEKALVYQKVTNYPAPSTAPESMQARQGTDPLRRALPQVKIEFNPAQAVQPTEPALPPARPAARPTPPPKPGNDSSGNLLQAATALINEHKFDSLPQ